MPEIFKYSNGLRLVVENMPAVRSVAAGIWVGAGCSHESGELNGISHFIEHMLFKGTATRNAFEVADSFESLGAAVNAFTTKESTCFYYKAVDDYNEKCFEVLSDIFHNSVFDADETAREKNVVIEEINMVEDSPEDICYDLLAKCVYGEGHPLGQTILGTAENIRRISKEDIRTYMCKYYNPANTIVCFTGSITMDGAKRLVEKYLLSGFCCDAYIPEYPEFFPTSPRLLVREKDIEQANIALRFPSFPINSKESPALSVLNFILGGSMSSRLFQAVRERLGLAYSIYTAPSAQKNNGSFIVYCNTNPSNSAKAVEAVHKEISQMLKEGISTSEFNRAKTQMKSIFVFGQESVQSTMISTGKLLLLTDTLFDPNQKIAEMDAVTADDVMDVARTVLDFKKVCGAYLGKSADKNLLDIFHK